jgi:hypothetical protein
VSQGPDTIEPAFDLVPSDLETLEAGPEFAAALSRLDLDRVAPEDLVTIAAAHERMASHHQARLYRAASGVVDHHTNAFGDLACGIEGIALEVGAVLRSTTETQMGPFAVLADPQGAAFSIIEFSA